MSALVLAAVRELLSWEIDHHTGSDEGDRALREAASRLAPYGRNDLVTRLLSAVIATSRDERERADAIAVESLVAYARRQDVDAIVASDDALRRPRTSDGGERRREAAGE